MIDDNPVAPPRSVSKFIAEMDAADAKQADAALGPDPQSEWPRTEYLRLREAMVIAPAGGGGAARETLERSLIDAFGGFTKSWADGAWRADDGRLHREPVMQYVVAMAPNRVNDLKLKYIAQRFGRDAQQISVYIRYASGDVELLTIGA